MEIQHQASSISELIRKLESIGYKFFDVKEEDDLVANLKQQIERINEITLSEVDFVKVLGHISCLRSNGANCSGGDDIEIKRNGGEVLRIHLLDRSNMSRNTFQFAHKLFGDDEVVDPYEVVLYVNGLPFANVNLKKMDYLVGSTASKIKSYSVVQNL